MIPFLRDLWRLTRPYWRSEERWKSAALLAVIVGLNLGIVYLNVLFNQWNNLFYNALQEKDRAAFVHQFVRFGELAAIFLAVAVYRLYLRQMLQIRWRRWLTERYARAWLDGHAYYRQQLLHGQADNPDQRIAEDVGAFVSQTLELSLGLLESVVTLLSFASILWGLSGSLELGGVSIPGSMLWIALIYAAFGTWLIQRIGRPLIGLNFQQQRYEADFRFSLVRLRENAESVALYGGEAEEARGLAQRFAKVVDNWWAIMRRQKRLTWFSAGYGQLAVVFPYVVASPRFFSGAMELGGLMQTASAFGQVQGALSWFIDAYAGLAEWRATVDRLVGFERSMETIDGLRHGESIRRRLSDPADGLTLDDLSLCLPDGTPLLTGLGLRLAAGSRTLISGPSGCGKSTLMRAIGGLWPFGRGTILLPAGQRLLFLPQKPYLPIAPLRAAIAYPDPAHAHADSALGEALRHCHLPHLIERLDEERHWGQCLSPGEQQRLAFARALLLKPAWLFLDEATSALDEAAEAALYGLLPRHLPDTAVVSIAHRPALAAFHHHRVDLGGLCAGLRPMAI